MTTTEAERTRSIASSVPMGLAVLVGAVVVGLAAYRFPPAGDGIYYDIVARRIAEGKGYTWQWPDGVVTYAAHYPVGYPALLGALYYVFGPRPYLAMVLNVVALMALVWSVKRIVASVASRRVALFAAMAVSFHPTLVGYLPLMMTELVSAALLGVASAVVVGPFRNPGFRRWGWLVTVGLLLGMATLVRPQQLLFAPFLGLLGWWRAAVPARAEQEAAGTTVLASSEQDAVGATVGPLLKGWAHSMGAAVLVSLIAISVCLPWTIRNQMRMKSPVFVSANAGWNLLIGTSSRGHGGWVSVDDVGIPAECRLVFDEVKKDRCFGAAARRRILSEPTAFFRLLPQKWERTFDDVGAPGWYLSVSNPAWVTARAKTALGALEVVAGRLLLLLALLGVARMDGKGKWWRRGLSAGGMLCCLLPVAWMGVLAFVVGAVSCGTRLLRCPAQFLAALGLGATAMVHGVFFGGARYVVVVLPLVLAAAFAAVGSLRSQER